MTRIVPGESIANPVCCNQCPFNRNQGTVACGVVLCLAPVIVNHLSGFDFYECDSVVFLPHYKNSKFSTLVYDPNQHRIKHSDSNGRVTNYVGGIYEEITRNGVTQKIHYIGDTALFISKGSNTNATYDYEYQHRDHIGSIVAVSEGAINSVLDVQWQSNGTWGERRYQQWDGPLDNLVIPTSTARGFTDHEHLDSVGLIHMNGRVYDPELGRFMSADPFVQAPYNSQSYNRYSYVFNNPLSFTDPSGYQTCSGYNTSDCGIDEIEVPGKRPSTDPCQYSMCGQDAYDYLRNMPTTQDWQNPHYQLPDQIYGAPHYAQGQHLLDQEARELQAEIVFGATTFVVSAEGLLLVKLANTAKGAKTLDLAKQLSLSPAAQRALLRTAMGASGNKVAHHVIPLEAIKRFPELMRKAAEGGFNINGKNNGALLNKADHIGGHPMYNNAVMDRLGRINPDLSPSRIADELQKASNTLQNSIKQGTFGPWG